MRVVFVAACCAVAATAAHAAEPAGAGNTFRYSMSAGATRSDNPGRTAAGSESETSLEAGLAAGWRYDAQRLSSRLDADLRFISHTYGDFEDQLGGALVGNASWRLASWLDWSIADNFGQSLINSQDTARADNTQNTNNFSTGPDFLFTLGPRTRVTLQGRWSDVSYQKSDFGSNKVAGALGLVRQVGARANVSLNGSTEHVQQKSSLPGRNDYDIHSASLGWDASSDRTTLKLRTGVSALDDGADTEHSALVDFSLVRKLTARVTMSLSAGRNFGNAADVLQRQQDIAGVTASDRPAAASADPLRADLLTASWNLQGQRMTVTASANWRRERHRDQLDLDRNAWGGGLRATRTIGPRLSLNFFADYLNEDYSRVSIQSDEWSTGVGLNWRFTPAFAINAEGAHLIGDGDTTAGPNTREYTENRYTLRLVWTPAR
jgi:hypothetical protein